MENKFYVYILKCIDDTLYTGYTNNLEKRVLAHKSGKGAKYTRGRAPLQLVFSADFPTKEDAMKAEYRIKRMTKKEKEHLIKEGGAVYHVAAEQLSERS